MTLFSRLFKLFISVIITPLFVTGVFLFYYQDHSKTAILENYFNLADISASYIKRNIGESAARLDFLGQAASSYEGQSAAFENILNDSVKSNPEIIFAALLGKDGKELFRSEANDASRILGSIDISQDPSFGSINDKDISISYVDYTLDRPLVEIIYPLSNGNYIFAVLDLSGVWYSVGMQRLGVTGGLYLASEEGFLNFNILPAPKISGGALSEVLNKDNGLIKSVKSEQGDKFVGAYAQTILPGVYVLALQYGKEAFYTITLTSWIIAFFILATTTLSYFAAYNFSKEISEPIERLTEGAQEISSGKFDVSLDTSESWGEFEILINTFNEMASRLSVYQAVQLDKLLDEKKKIDMLAGPSEVMVVVDRTSSATAAAADLLSQAEHGKDSQAMLLVRADNPEEAECIYRNVDEAIGKELERIGRHEYMLPSLSHSYAFPLYSDEALVDAVNEYAPEHLIISTGNPDAILRGVENAGSVFLGSWTPESAGDYASGTNHTLPTSGWARSSSGVSVDSFIKKITVQQITREGLGNLGPVIQTLAEAEGLEAHSYAVTVRLSDD